MAKKLAGQDACYPASWQQELHQLKETESKLLQSVAEVKRRVNESDPTDVAARLASLGEILVYLEESARQLVGLVEAFLRLQEEAIRQTRVQTLQRVGDEIDVLLQRLRRADELGHPSD